MQNPTPEDIIYLNNAATSYPKNNEVTQIYLETINAPPVDVRSSSTRESHIDISRRKIAALCGVDLDHVYFSAGATQALNEVIKGTLVHGDGCFVDNRSHNAVLRCVANIPGISWEVLSLYGVGEELKFDALDALKRTNAKLICLTHASNVTGSIYELDKIISYIKKVNKKIRVLVDASQSAGVQDLMELSQADYVVFPAHKYLYSVPGAAVLVAKYPLNELIHGGTGSQSSQLEMKSLKGNAYFIESGTQNIPAISALAAAMEKIDSSSIHRIAELRMILADKLRAVAGIRVFASQRRNNGIVSFAHDEGGAENIWIPFLFKNNIIARGGMHCAPLVHQQMGLEKSGSIRLSIGRYNTLQHVQYAIDVIDALAKDLKGKRYVGAMFTPFAMQVEASIYIRSYTPCADNHSVSMIEGQLLNGNISSTKENLLAMSWEVTELKSSNGLYAKAGISTLFIMADGEFTIANFKEESKLEQFLKKCFSVQKINY